MIPKSQLTSDVTSKSLDEATTLVEAFVKLADRHPKANNVVLVGEDGETSLGFAEILSGARAIAAGLHDRGIRQDDRVLIVLPTGRDLVVTYLGVMFLGAIPALGPIPSHRVAEEKVYQRLVHNLVRSADIRTVLCSNDVATVLSSDEAGIDCLVIVPSRLPTDASMTDPVAARAGDVATIQFSSGSTGIPKGIVLSHGAMLNNIRAVRNALRLGPTDVSVNWIPLYHDMGLIDAFLLPLLSGCPTVLIPTFDFLRDPSVWLWALHRYSGALSWAPNFAYTLCAKRLSDAAIDGLDLSSWRIAINASEPVLVPTMTRFITRFAPHGFRPEAMKPAWGLAENVTIATVEPLDEVAHVETIDRDILATQGVARPTKHADGFPSVSVGRCIPRCRIEIRLSDGHVVDDRVTGEVWMTSDSIADGYHDQPKTTADVFVDGWIRTGDRGYIADGRLYFVSREKDLIVIAGEKYAPHDIENAVNGVDGVREGCAVAFGLTNESDGTERLATVVETRLENPTERADLDQRVRNAVREQTGLRLHHVWLVPPGGVEKTTSGKLARRATMLRYAATV